MADAAAATAPLKTAEKSSTADIAAAAAAGASRKVEVPAALKDNPAVQAAAAAAEAKEKFAADTKAKLEADAAAKAKETGKEGEKPPSWAPPADEAAAKAAADAKKAEDDKKTADAAAKAAGETKFELKAPEGVKVEPAVLEKYQVLAKDLGLSPDQAQKLFDRDLAAQKQAEQAIQVEMRSTDDRWGKELVQSWGEKAAENDVLAKRGFELLDPSGALRKGMQAAGLLRWPVAVNAVVELARRMGEDRIGAQTAGQTKKQDLTPEQKFEEQYKKAAAEAARKAGKG